MDEISDERYVYIVIKIRKYVHTYMPSLISPNVEYNKSFTTVEANFNIYSENGIVILLDDIYISMEKSHYVIPSHRDAPLKRFNNGKDMFSRVNLQTCA